MLALRRRFLSLLPAIPGIPTRLTRDPATRLDQETDLQFWFYIHAAVTRDRAMSTKRSRRHAVSEMNLTALTDSEAREVLRRANADDLGLDDMPEQFHRFAAALNQAHRLFDRLGGTNVEATQTMPRDVHLDQQPAPTAEDVADELDALDDNDQP